MNCCGKAQFQARMDRVNKTVKEGMTCEQVNEAVHQAGAPVGCRCHNCFLLTIQGMKLSGAIVGVEVNGQERLYTREYLGSLGSLVSN